MLERQPPKPQLSRPPPRRVPGAPSARFRACAALRHETCAATRARPIRASNPPFGKSVHGPAAIHSVRHHAGYGGRTPRCSNPVRTCPEWAIGHPTSKAQKDATVGRTQLGEPERPIRCDAPGHGRPPLGIAGRGSRAPLEHRVRSSAQASSPGASVHSSHEETERCGRAVMPDAGGRGLPELGHGRLPR